jgi:hypothetical protein
MNSMWWNTLGFFGAVMTPTKLDRLDSSCAAFAITRCGWSACSCASIGSSSCRAMSLGCAVSIVSTKRR